MLTQQIAVTVYYIDRSPGAEPNVYNFGDTQDPSCIHLLYRPGHYDVLTPHLDPPAHPAVL